MMRRLNFIILGTALLVAGCTMGPQTTGPVITPGPTITPATPGTGQSALLSAEQLQNASRATVQIIVAQDQGGTLQPMRTGSGALISATGQIVTTCTLACDAPILLILVTADMNVPPEALYRAQVTVSDEALNLATLQINQNAAGSPLDSNSLSLPFFQRGSADVLNTGDPLEILSYGLATGSTVALTSTAISGFGTAQVAGAEQRVVIRTGASLSGGANGGAAVNNLGQLVGIPSTVDPSGGTAGGGTLLLPVGLINLMGGGLGGSTQTSGTGGTGGTRQPPIAIVDKFEPNDNFNQASGPLTSGQTVQATIGSDSDVDTFYFDAATTSQVSVSLTGIPSGVDYDLYVYFNNNVVGQSENQNQSDEAVDFRPAAPGRFYVAVSSFKGSDAEHAYSLSVKYDGTTGGSSGSGGAPAASAVRVTGTIINGHTGRAFDRGVFGILNPGVSCDQFFNAPSLDMSLVTANVATNSSTGAFTLVGVPTGQNYAAFFFTGGNHVCQNGWLSVPAGSGDVNLDPITLAF